MGEQSKKEILNELEEVDNSINPHTGKPHGRPQGRDKKRRDIFAELHGRGHRSEEPSEETTSTASSGSTTSTTSTASTTSTTSTTSPRGH